MHSEIAVAAERRYAHVEVSKIPECNVPSVFVGITFSVQNHHSLSLRVHCSPGGRGVATFVSFDTCHLS